MCGVLRTTHAEVLRLNLAQQRIGLKSHFDETIEVNCEIDPARFAMNLRTNFAERLASLSGPATQGTQQLPLQIEQAKTRRTQASFQNSAPGQLPFICQCIGANARQREVVRATNKINQSFDDLCIRAFARAVSHQ